MYGSNQANADVASYPGQANYPTSVSGPTLSISDLSREYSQASLAIGILCERLRNISRSLTGGPVKEAAPTGPRPVPNGMCGELSETLGQIRRDLEHAEDTMNAIIAALGLDQPPQGR